VRVDAIRTRPGWDATAAVRNGRIHEIRSNLILQPGITALRDGLAELRRHIAAAAGVR
jgi:iron complex transport system substrate-binding protein